MRSIRRHGGVLVAAALAALAVIAVGCGGEDDGGTVTADSYVSDVCAAMSEMVGIIEEGAELQEIENATPAQGRDLLVSFLADSASAVDSARNRIEDAGVPDVEDGEEVAEAVSSATGELLATFEEARSEAEEISTESQAEFSAQAREISGAFRASTEQIGESLDAVGENEELEAAAQESEACQAL